MSISLYRILDFLLTCFHDLLTLWNLFAWLVPKFRNLHFITINLTLFSWIGLGYFYGWGYCFLTEYHYQIKQELGVNNLPPSYIQLRIYEIFGIMPDLETTNLIVGAGFSIVVVLSYGLWLKKFFKKIDSN